MSIYNEYNSLGSPQQSPLRNTVEMQHTDPPNKIEINSVRLQWHEFERWVAEEHRKAMDARRAFSEADSLINTLQRESKMKASFDRRMATEWARRLRKANLSMSQWGRQTSAELEVFAAIFPNGFEVGEGSPNDKVHIIRCNRPQVLKMFSKQAHNASIYADRSGESESEHEILTGVSALNFCVDQN